MVCLNVAKLWREIGETFSKYAAEIRGSLTKKACYNRL